MKTPQDDEEFGALNALTGFAMAATCMPHERALAAATREFLEARTAGESTEYAALLLQLIQAVKGLGDLALAWQRNIMTADDQAGPDIVTADDPERAEWLAKLSETIPDDWTRG